MFHLFVVRNGSIFDFFIGVYHFLADLFHGICYFLHDFCSPLFFICLYDISGMFEIFL